MNNYENIPKDKHIIDTNNSEIINDEKAIETVREVIKHRQSVNKKLNFLSKEISKRGEEHDLSNYNIQKLIG